MNPVAPSDPQRVLDTLALRPVDTPALALSLSLQAARHLGRSVPETLRDTAAFAGAQLAMHERWQHDVIIAMFYAAVEAQAMGSDVLFFDDGPPNAGAPIIDSVAAIDRLDPEQALKHSELSRTEELIRRLRDGVGARALVSGVCVGPLSGPVMLAGMERWLDMLLLRPDDAERLVERYGTFAMAWAQRQHAAGADAITWFEPLASTDMLPIGLIERLALPWLRRVCERGFPVALHLASARAGGVAAAAADCGISLLSAGRFDDLQELHGALGGKKALIGNMDGVSMTRWNADDVCQIVDAFLKQASSTPGLILSDAHGEIPYQVDPAILDLIVARARAR